VTAQVTVETHPIETQRDSVPIHQCVIEIKGAYLPARRSVETADPEGWDLSVAGLSKRQANTEPVKRLRHMIIQFDNQEGRCTLCPAL